MILKQITSNLVTKIGNSRLLLQMRTPEAAPIAVLNDRLRREFIGGLIVTTPGVRDLSHSTRASVLAAVRGFDDFSEDNDPYGERDFGAIEVEGKKYFWKIDYYDQMYEGRSPNPLDLSVKRRVLTIMQAHEYQHQQDDVKIAPIYGRLFNMPNSNSSEHGQISVAKARRILGMIAKNYSDEEIIEIVRLLSDVAELSYRDYLRPEGEDSASSI